MGVTPEEVRRLADLAMLELTEEEVERAARELGSILSHVERLPGGSAPAPGEGRAPLRPDREEFDPLARPPAEIAPAWVEGFFVVPRLPALDG